MAKAAYERPVLFPNAVRPERCAMTLCCSTQESCFLGEIFSADPAPVVRRQWLQGILNSPSSILFGCGSVALWNCGAAIMAA
jgi:hypothetical protein